MSDDTNPDTLNDKAQKLCERWIDNDANTTPFALGESTKGYGWTESVRNHFSECSGPNVTPDSDALLGIYKEAWKRFRASSRGAKTKDALMVNIRNDGHSGQVWVADMMALVRYTGSNLDDALDLLYEAVLLATNFDSIGKYTRLKVHLLGVVLEELVNSIIVESSEPRQAQTMHMQQNYRYDYNKPHLLKSVVIRQSTAITNNPKNPGDDDYVTSDMNSLLNDDQHIKKILLMCQNIYTALWLALRGNSNISFAPKTIERLLSYFELSFFWSHRSLSWEQKKALKNIDVSKSLVEMEKASRKRFGALINNYHSNIASVEGLVPRLYDEWRGSYEAINIPTTSINDDDTAIMDAFEQLNSLKTRPVLELIKEEGLI